MPSPRGGGTDKVNYSPVETAKSGVVPPVVESAAAVGTFDGVHRGHLAVLDTLRDVAYGRGVRPLAFTFDRHPLSLIAPERAPLLLSTPGERASLIRREGVEPVILPFDEDLRSTTAEGWMRTLHDDFGVRVLVVGYDNTFGCDGVNLSLSDYARIGKGMGIDVVEAPRVEGVSSSAVRKAVASGDVEGGSMMLGRPFRLEGHVVEGNRLGRTIGFPTANLLPSPGYAVPATGVYTAIVTLPDGTLHPAMVDVGTRPTVDSSCTHVIEAHLLHWNGDIYGLPISVDFISRLRDEKKFDSVEALRRQLEKDRSETDKFFSGGVILSTPRVGNPNISKI